MKNLLFALVPFFLAFASSEAQTLESVLAKHFKAIGQEKLSKIQGLVIDMELKAQGMQMQVKSHNKRPNKTRLETNVMGQEIVQAYDGKTAWMINPATGKADVMPAEQAQQVISQSDIDGPLHNYKEKGNKLEYMGKEVIDGKEYHKLKIVLAFDESMETEWFIDGSTFLVAKQKIKVTKMGQEMVVENEILEYKDMDGVKMLGKLVSKTNGVVNLEMEVKKITVQDDMKDSLFEMPK